MNYAKVVNDYLNGKAFKRGKFISNGKTLVALQMKKEYNGQVKEFRDIIAHKYSEEIIVNASRLRILEDETRRLSRTALHPIQAEFEGKVTMMPLYQFQDMKLKLDKLKIIDSGKPEKVLVKDGVKYNKETNKYEDNIVERHFTGARLFQIDGKTYLFDIDREEIKHKIFNPFLVELNLDEVMNKPLTIKDAYETLIPIEVKQAMNNGVKVIRQGEWFLIKDRPKKDTDLLENLGGVLQVGDNRPNYVDEKLKGEELVSGLMRHSGREHRDVKLDTKFWWRPVPNTASRSFTITGDVD